MHKMLIEEQGFKLLEQIDNTIHTEIWKANQRELDRVVCLQVLKPEASRNALELEHFLLIARIFAKVKSETVAAVFDIVSHNDLHYAVMEYVDGPSVGSLVANGHKISENHILQIASSLAQCFEQLWQKDRIIHRNLKGETVQIDPRGVAKLTDFSLAVTASQDLTALDGGHIVGTPSFIAPEYAQGSKNLTTQADMYSFGALLYQLATGHAPFSSMSPVDALGAQIRNQIQPPHCVNRDISIAFSWFIHRLMMKNPNNRYPDWHSVVADIHLLMQGEPPAGIQTEERFLSTIDSKPLLDAMNGVVAEEEAADVGDAAAKTGPSVKLQSSKQKVTQIELEHKRDIQSSNLRLASVMTLVMLFCFAGIFWYRGIWQPETNRIAEALAKKDLEVVVPPPKVLFKQPTKAVEPVAEPTKEPDPVSDGAEDPKPERPPEKPVVRPPLPVVPPPTPPPVVKTNDVPKPVALGPMPEELKKALASAAKAGDLAAMRAAFAAEKSAFIGKEPLKHILEKAPAGNRLLERTMDSKKDQPISFTWRGKSRIVVPREVSENSVTLEANGRRQEIMFSDLTPDEVVSLVNKPQAEAESLSYCLLLMKSAQKSEVPLYASKCLPLQEVLLEAAQE
jgi:serine/threonine protein kinase